MLHYIFGPNIKQNNRIGCNLDMKYHCNNVHETMSKMYTCLIMIVTFVCLDFPTAFNITVDTTKDHSVKVKMECNKVYPLPTCSVNIGVSNISKTE